MADFLNALNQQDLDDAAEQFVDVVRYREDCVDYTPGIVNSIGAKTSIRTVWKRLPDLSIEVHDLFGDATAIFARARTGWTSSASAPTAICTIRPGPAPLSAAGST